jgi:hypothetical protein
VTKRAMASATRVACSEVGNGDGGKSDDNEGGGQTTATRTMVKAMAMMWAMATARRVAGNKKGNGKSGKGNGVCGKGRLQ